MTQTLLRAALLRTLMVVLQPLGKERSQGRAHVPAAEHVAGNLHACGRRRGQDRRTAWRRATAASSSALEAAAIALASGEMPRDISAFCAHMLLTSRSRARCHAQPVAPPHMIRIPPAAGQASSSDEQKPEAGEVKGIMRTGDSVLT